MSNELTPSQLETLGKVTTMIEADFGREVVLEILLLLSPEAREIYSHHQDKLLAQRYYTYLKEVETELSNLRQHQRQSVSLSIEQIRQQFQRQVVSPQKQSQQASSS